MVRLRALVYADQMRQGKDEPAAYDAAMALSVKALDGYFADDEDDAMPDEPDTESGKDGSADA